MTALTSNLNLPQTFAFVCRLTVSEAEAFAAPSSTCSNHQHAHLYQVLRLDYFPPGAEECLLYPLKILIAEVFPPLQSDHPAVVIPNDLSFSHQLKEIYLSFAPPYAMIFSWLPALLSAKSRRSGCPIFPMLNANCRFDGVTNACT